MPLRKKPRRRPEKQDPHVAAASGASDSKVASEAAGAASAGLDLLGGGEEGGDAAELTVAESFARKYNARKDRQELVRAKRILEEEEARGSSESESESEDEDAALLTRRVEGRIFDTLHRIKSRDPTIYDKDHEFFQDDDFDDAGAAKVTAHAATGESRKSVRYKDFLRDTLVQEGADAVTREEEALEAFGENANRRRKTPNEEQRELKAGIVAAAEAADFADSDSDGGFLTLKQKTSRELQQEDDEFKAFAFQNAGRGTEGCDEIISRYWKTDEDLDESERFLRDYVLNRGWLETTSLQASGVGGNNVKDTGDESQEEEAHLEEADAFEKDYNFRFEMDEGMQIQGHARFQESSVRDQGDKRKRQRKERAERKENEKIRRTEELKRLKNLKKQEIMRRLQQLRDITGNEECALGAVDLDADFDPERHDQEVGHLLGADYDDRKEPLSAEELVCPPEGCEDLDVSAAAAESLRRRVSAATVEGDSVDVAADEGERPSEGLLEEGDEIDPEMWFLCDSCQTGIPGGKKRFDCTVCDNYTLCAKCFRIRRHSHKFVRRRVPERCMPPEDLKETEANVKDADEVLDEYFQLDYEDIIGGDLPTRFKYRKVESDGFGLTAPDILRKSDQELNRVIPLKRLRPFRTQGSTNAPEGKRSFAPARKWSGRQMAAQKQGGPGRRKRSAPTMVREEVAVRAGLGAQRLSAYNLEADRGAERQTKRNRKCMVDSRMGG